MKKYQIKLREIIENKIQDVFEIEEDDSSILIKNSKTDDFYLINFKFDLNQIWYSSSKSGALRFKLSEDQDKISFLNFNNLDFEDFFDKDLSKN